MFSKRKVMLALSLLLGLTCAGTAGYRVIEGAGWSDALFMTVITLSTVGYSEVFPLSEAGRMFTVVLIVVGIGAVFGITSVWVKSLLEGELEQVLGRRRVSRVLRKISDHYIVCGYGRFGRRVADELRSRGEKFVVIDNSARLPEGTVAYQADATDEATLRGAGVERARGLLAALPSDADNVYITRTELRRFDA